MRVNFAGDFPKRCGWFVRLGCTTDQTTGPKADKSDTECPFWATSQRPPDEAHSRSGPRVFRPQLATGRPPAVSRGLARRAPRSRRSDGPGSLNQAGISPKIAAGGAEVEGGCPPRSPFGGANRLPTRGPGSAVSSTPRLVHLPLGLKDQRPPDLGVDRNGRIGHPTRIDWLSPIGPHVAATIACPIGRHPERCRLG